MISYKINSLKFFSLSIIICFHVTACQNTTNTQSTTTNKEDHSKTINPLTAQWDTFNFSDSSYLTDPDQTEQRISDYIGSFQKHPINLVSASIKDVLKKAEQTPSVFQYFTKQFAHYLYDPNSPMRSDLYYQPVLEYLTTSARSSDTDKIRYQMQLDRVRKNQPNTVISDFSYLDTKNRTEKLHDRKGILRLLVFYDPTCAHCKEIIAILKKDEAMNQLIAKGKLQTIAIDPLGDVELWKSYQNQIPENWINGIDRQDAIIKNELFSIAAFPTLYLVDEQNVIIAKDPDYQVAQAMLAQYAQQIN